MINYFFLIHILTIHDFSFKMKKKNVVLMNLMKNFGKELVYEFEILNFFVYIHIIIDGNSST